MDKILNLMSFLIIIVGTLGSLFNLIIFQSRKFRLNSCIFYLFCSTIFDMSYLLISGLTRFIENDLTKFFLTESIFFCKFRIYFVVLTPTLSIYYLMFASIDRCLSTSSTKKWRNFCTMKIARRISILTLIFTMIFNSHIIYFYQIQKKLNRNKCVPYGNIYRIFFSISVLLSNPFVVYMIMFSCTIITLRRIRQSRWKIRSSIEQRRNERQRNIDRYLIRIIFIQIGLGMLFTFFRCGFLIYTFFTININKTSSHITLDLFLDKLSLFIYYLNFAKSFPVNILISQFFRQVFREQIRFLIPSIFHENQEQPSTHRMTIKYQSQVGSSIEQTS